MLEKYYFIFFTEHTEITAGPKDYEVIAGLTATFNCTATADPSLRLNIEWLANDEPVNFENESSRFVKIDDDSMAITKTTELDSGTYTCLASTVLDNATANATLIVLVYNDNLLILLFTIHVLKV